MKISLDPKTKEIVTTTTLNKIVRLWRWLDLRELSVLLVLFTLIGSLWILAEEVMEGETSDVDRIILLSMRNATDLSDPLGPLWVEEIGRDITALGGNAVLTLITLAVVGFLVLEGKRRIALILIMATLGALGVSTLLKHSFDRDRPNLVPHGAVVYTASFPSGHSMLAASTYLTMAALLMRIQRNRVIKAYILLVAMVLTLLVGISRVYLGVHWPTDVLAGWTAGTGWAILCWLLARWLQLHGAIEDEEDAVASDYNGTTNSNTTNSNTTNSNGNINSNGTINSRNARSSNNIQT